MKWRVLIGLVFGLVLMIASMELYAKENVFFASIAGIFAAYMFLLAGIETGEQKKDKLNYEPVKFGELEPGSYLFMTTPVQHINCSLTGDCDLYFTFLERNGEAIPVVIGVSAKIEIQNAMRGKFINQIKSGEGLEIDENHNVTKIET
jgi:hypothetical protein